MMRRWLHLNELHKCGICLKDDPFSKTLQSFVWVDWEHLMVYGTYACPECLSHSDEEIKAAIKQQFEDEDTRKNRS